MSDIARQLGFSEIEELTNKFIENLNADGRLLINYLYMQDYDINYRNGNPPLSTEDDIRMFLNSYKTADKIGFSGVSSFRDNNNRIKDQIWVYQKKESNWW